MIEILSQYVEFSGVKTVSYAGMYKPVNTCPILILYSSFESADQGAEGIVALVINIYGGC